MIPASLAATVLYIEDPRRSKEFYERAFGLAPVNEDENSVTFRFDKTLIHLLRKDADDACAELRERGVELVNGPVDQPWGIRAATFADPDGHLWEVAAEL